MSSKPSRFLVTGGTGFLGAHVVDLLLERGIAVVVPARSESKAKAFAERRSKFKDLLEMTITGDLSAIGAFDELAKDVDVIIHCASPQPSAASPDSPLSKTIVEPAIFGTLSILQAARKNPTVKRLVLTSSLAAVYNSKKEVSPGPDGDSYTADDWNPLTYAEGMKTNTPVDAYVVAKKYAELEAWAGVDPTSKHLRQLELDPSYPRYGKPTDTASTFDLTVICPTLILGTWVHPLGPSGTASPNCPNREIVKIIRGEYRSSKLPGCFTSNWTDVREVALAHVGAALQLDPDASNGRYITCSPDKFNYHMVGEIIREEFPEWAEKVLPPKEEAPPFINISFDGTPATRDLGVTYRSLRSCIVDLVRQLREEIPLEAETNKS